MSDQKPNQTPPADSVSATAERYRYRIRPTGHNSSSKYGPCEVCRQHCAEVFHQVEEKACSTGWTRYQCTDLFGHEHCLLARRRPPEGERVERPLATLLPLLAGIQIDSPECWENPSIRQDMRRAVFYARQYIQSASFNGATVRVADEAPDVLSYLAELCEAVETLASRHGYRRPLCLPHAMRTVERLRG